MRFDELRSIAHNIADSLASGVSFPVGAYELDVFGEAANGTAGFIEVDFLAGTATGSPISTTLSQAIDRFRDALPQLWGKHGADVSAFRQLRARYSGTGPSTTFTVTVEDILGRIATDTYTGIPGSRPRTTDHLGRIRRLRPPVRRAGR